MHPAQNTPRPLMCGQTIADGKYRLVRLIGEGGGGQVYEGEQTVLGKKVAIKVLAPEYATNTDLVRRFLREARATARVQHENVIQIYDFGSTGTGTAYISMEFLEGESVADLIDRDGALGWKQIKTISLQICRALHIAHVNGVVHRDVKPDNCFRVRTRRNADFVKVLDFGLAKVFGDERQPQLAFSTLNRVFGTPEYMAPEQAQGQPADDRSDVYAVGIMLFEMLTGRVPFTSGASYLATLAMHVEAPVPRPSDVAPSARISPAADELVLKALHKDPAKRFQSMKELGTAIAAIPTTESGQLGMPGYMPPKRWIDQPNAKTVVALSVACTVLSMALVGLSIYSFL